MKRKPITIVISLIIIFMIVTAIIARKKSDKILQDFNDVNNSLKISDSTLQKSMADSIK